MLKAMASEPGFACRHPLGPAQLQGRPPGRSQIANRLRYLTRLAPAGLNLPLRTLFPLIRTLREAQSVPDLCKTVPGRRASRNRAVCRQSLREIRNLLRRQRHILGRQGHFRWRDSTWSSAVYPDRQLGARRDMGFFRPSGLSKSGWNGVTGLPISVPTLRLRPDPAACPARCIRHIAGSASQ